jgi:hypothetical protein
MHVDNQILDENSDEDMKSDGIDDMMSMHYDGEKSEAEPQKLATTIKVAPFSKYAAFNSQPSRPPGIFNKKRTSAEENARFRSVFDKKSPSNQNEGGGGDSSE